MTESLEKICIMTSAHPVFDIRIFHKEARSLLEEGYDVTIIAQNKKEEIVDGIKIIPLKKPENRFKRFFYTTYLVLNEARRLDADIYHFHDPELIAVGLLLRLKGKKVIYDVHEDLPEQILSKDWIWHPIRKIISTIVRIIEKNSSRFFSGIIAATNIIGRKFSKYSNNVVVIQNYPLLNELLINSDVKETHKENKLVYVGGITVIRGIREMVRAMDYIPEKYNARLILAGQFSSATLKEEVKHIPGWEKVEFLGWVEREEIARLFTRVKAGLVLFAPEPNHINAQPNKMFEYMSAGIPVVCSNFPLWKEIIEGNECGLTVDPLNPEEIAAATRYIFDHPMEAKKMGENGRRAVEDKFNWENEKKKLIKLYDELL